MGFIRLVNVSFHYQDSDILVFDHLNLEINTNWRGGIVARNGRGKTTLLKLIHGVEEVSQGSLLKDCETDLFPLEIRTPYLSVLSIIKNYLGPYEACERMMQDFLEGRTDEDSYFEALNQYLEFDGYEIESRIKRECHPLGLDEEALNRPYETLSGGEQTKVQMIMLFLKSHTFILLDEPTNHLDAEGIQLLAQYLKTKQGFLIVSHHRDFLDECIDHVIAIEKEQLTVMQGTYRTYEQEYEWKKELEQHQRLKIEKEVNRLEVAARERRHWSHAKEKEKIGAGDKGFVTHRAAKLMKRALSVERRINEQLEEKKALVKYREHQPYLLIKQEQVPKVVLQVSHLKVAFGERVILNDICFQLESGERLAITGPNGSGKSTLIKTILGELPYQDGFIKLDNRVHIAYVSQFPRYKEGNLREILRDESLEETRFRSILGALSCHRDIFERDLSTFSLGELRKVDIARSLYHKNQLLIWDEPLNGLDIMNRQAIEAAILASNATMIFIEHDQTFIDKVATHQLELMKYNK